MENCYVLLLVYFNESSVKPLRNFSNTIFLFGYKFGGVLGTLSTSIFLGLHSLYTFFMILLILVGVLIYGFSLPSIYYLNKFKKKIQIKKVINKICSHNNVPSVKQNEILSDLRQILKSNTFNLKTIHIIVRSKNL